MSTTPRTFRWPSPAEWTASCLRFGFGLGAGVILIGLLDRLFAAFGHLPEMVAAVLLVAAGLVSVCQHASTGPRKSAVVGLGGVLAVAAAGWLGPWVILGAESLWRVLPDAFGANVGTRLAVHLVASFVTLAPLVVGLAWWFRSATDQRGGAGVLLGVCCGPALTVLWLAPSFGTWVTTVMGTSTVVVAGATAWWFGHSQSTAEDSNEAVANDSIWSTVAVALVGAVAACASWAVFEIVLPTTAFDHLAWIALLLGAILVPRLRRTWSTDTAVVAACGLLVALLVGFDRVVDLFVYANAWVESTWLSVAIRIVLVGIVFAGIGAAWSLAGSTRSSFALPSPVTFAVGFVTASSLGLVVGAPTVVASLAVAAVAFVVVRRVWSGEIPSARWQRVIGYVPLALLLASPWFVRSVRVDRSAKLLFSSHIAQSVRSGESPTALEQSNAARLVESRTGPFGTHTIWSHFGLQHEWRTGGVPSGLASRLPRVCPQSPVGTLTAALPLLLHGEARSVLVLGASDGVAIATTLDFPVRRVECVEPDRTRIALLRDRVWSGVPKSPFADDRFEIVDGEPRIHLLQEDERFDVVLCDPPSSTLARIAPWYGPDFYARCRDRLGERGLFCQRLRSVDYGPESVVTLLEQFGSAFPDVLVMAGGPGELLLVGANAESSIGSHELAERLRSPHVKHVFAMANWDWSTPLELATLDAEAIEALVANTPNRSQGDLRYRLPIEALRWDRKYGQQVEALAAVARRPIDFLPVESRGRMAAQMRIADRDRAAEIVREYPDEWWIYRRHLKQRLQSSTRAVEPVSGRSSVHPEDRRRLDYLVALGQALRENPPSLVTIEPLLDFADTRDPYLEFFVRAETVRLLADCPERLPGDELEQRLWLLLHAAGSDRSVHNAVEAVQLVTSTPDVVPDPETRWDVLNGLMQLLVNRWQARSASSALPAEVGIADAGLTLEAQRAAFDAMGTLAAEGVVSDEVWERRAAYLQQELVGPLKEYRGQLRTHQAREVAKAKAVSEE